MNKQEQIKFLKSLWESYLHPMIPNEILDILENLIKQLEIEYLNSIKNYE